MIRTKTALLSLLVLGACATEIGHHTGDLAEASARFGDAVRYNAATQTVNPQGSAEDVTASGARTAKAVQAYAADKVEKPVPAATTAAGASAQ